jgi:hypothetical protein
LISRRLEGGSHTGVDILVIPVYQLTAEVVWRQDRPQGMSGERTIRGDKKWLLMESGKKGRHVDLCVWCGRIMMPLTPSVNNENRDNATMPDTPSLQLSRHNDTRMSRT